MLILSQIVFIIILFLCHAKHDTTILPKRKHTSSSVAYTKHVEKGKEKIHKQNNNN